MSAFLRVDDPFAMYVDVLRQTEENGEFSGTGDDCSLFEYSVPLLDVGDWVCVPDGTFRPILHREFTLGNNFFHVVYFVDTWRAYPARDIEPPAAWLEGHYR